MIKGLQVRSQQFKLRSLVRQHLTLAMEQRYHLYGAHTRPLRSGR
ncbi:4764_t:CDS:2, partial [Dentiscutata erythropus]